MATKEQKRRYQKIVELGCILCKKLGYGETIPECHHIRRAGRRSDAPVIGLCPFHHRGNGGIHGMGRKAFERHYQTTEEDLLAWTEELIDSNPT